MSCDHPINDLKQLTKGETWIVACQVESNGGFSAPTTLSCGRVTKPFSFDLGPGPMPCSISPAVVTPPVDGTVSATFTLYVPPDTTWGNYGYGIRTDSAAVMRLEPMRHFNLQLKQPELKVECDAPTRLDTTVNQPSARISCQVSVAAGFDDTVKAVSSFNNSWQYPAPAPCDVQPSVPWLTFGDEAGTQNLTFTVTCSAEANNAWYLVRFEAGTGDPQFVDIGFRVNAVNPSS